ncbi:MAG: hypothetical protein O7F76_01220 [Planctomycetota bacterium]|nr:hypothetical protein [Planctomycetota bacterium]
MTVRIHRAGRLGIVITIAAVVSCSEEPPKRPSPMERVANSGTIDSAAGTTSKGPKTATGAPDTATTRPKGSSKKAREIYASMKKVYAECESYADTGTIKTSLTLNSGFMRNLDMDQRFYTNFKRPDQLRFAHQTRYPFSRDWDWSVVWARGDQVKTSGFDLMGYAEDMLEEFSPAEGDAESAEDAAANDDSGGNKDNGQDDQQEAGAGEDDGQEKEDGKPTNEEEVPPGEDSGGSSREEDDAGEAVGAMTFAAGGFRRAEPTWKSVGLGVSVVSEIPGLILADKFETVGEGLASLENLQLEPEEMVGGEPCFKLVGDQPQDLISELSDVSFLSLSKRMKVVARYTLWIEKERRVIRKLVLSAGVMNMGRVNVPGQGSLRIPNMDFGYEKFFEPRLNEEVKWHELVFDVAGAVEGPTHGTASWRNDEFKPTTLSEPDARKAAGEIMAAMAEVYASCKSYQDRCVIETHSVDRGVFHARRLPFETAFVRAGGFRFSYREVTQDSDWTRHIICREGEQIRVWCHQLAGINERESMDEAILELGVHCKAPMDAIPGLLMPKEINNSYLVRPADMVLLGRQKVAGKTCNKLRGTDSLGWSMTLWIEVKRKLLRRMQAKFHGHDVPVWVTATYESRINKKVSKKYLTLGSAKSRTDG